MLPSDYSNNKLNKSNKLGKSNQLNNSSKSNKFGTDLTPNFERLVWKSRNGNFSDLPTSAKRFIYLLVPGLFCNNFGIKYMQDNIEHLQQLRLDVRKMDINTGGSVEENAEAIKDYIMRESRYHNKKDSNKKHSNKKFIIIGHSKGGVDAGTAIAKYNLYSYVEALIILQSPWKGTLIADGSAKYFTNVLSFVSKINKDAMRVLSHEERYKTLSNYPLDIHQVKTISFTSTIGDKKSLLYYIPDAIISRQYNTQSDGVLIPEDGIIPGSDYVHVDGLAHNESVILMGSRDDTNKLYPGDITYALIVLSLIK